MLKLLRSATPSALPPTIMMRSETMSEDTVANAMPRRHSERVLPTAMAPPRKTLIPTAVVPTKLKTVSVGAAASGRVDISGNVGRKPHSSSFQEIPTEEAAARNKAIIAIMTTPRPIPMASALSQYRIASSAAP
eukprot:Skav235015  [mRNA]  locus=scaffold276:237105:241118:- [translate_table: standard]